MKQNTPTGLKIAIIITAIALIASILLLLWVINRQDAPAQLTVTVAWNPHSTADDMVHALAAEMRTQLVIQHIPGANGANGLNAVYAAARDGENALSTSLSAFVTAEPMGFAESPLENWTGWLCAFAPAVIIVAADSPFTTMDDLTAALRRSDSLMCANSGFGTISFTSAELFREKGGFNFENIAYAGNNPAINALLNGNVDFAVLTSAEAIGALRSGEIRALATFSESDFSIAGSVIPPATGITASLDALLPFGEFYGIFIPEDTPQTRLNGIETEIQTAAASYAFTQFATEKGLATLTPNRTQNARVIDSFSENVRQTLQNAGLLPN